MSSRSGGTDQEVWKSFVFDCAHFGVFGVLAGLIAEATLARPEPSLRSRWWVVAAVAVYGIVDELHQSLVPMRHADPLDVIVDVLGATAFVPLWQGLRADLAWWRGVSRWAMVGVVALLFNAARYREHWWPVGD